jgi:hypothetical protein
VVEQRKYKVYKYIQCCSQKSQDVFFPIQDGINKDYDDISPCIRRTQVIFVLDPNMLKRSTLFDIRRVPIS